VCALIGYTTCNAEANDNGFL